MTSNDTRKQDLADAKAWLCARWHQKHPNEQHIIQLADYAAHLRATPKPPAGGDAIMTAALNQNNAMRQELAHVGNLVSDLARAMKVDQANDDGTWPDLAGRIQRLIAATPKPPANGDAGAVERNIEAQRQTIEACARLADRMDGGLDIAGAIRRLSPNAALALPAPVVERERFTGEQAWDELVNVDDRTSPEEYPDMCLITRDELIDFMNRAVLPVAASMGNL